MWSVDLKKKEANTEYDVITSFISNTRETL